jgi:hypothetical protein
MLHSYSIIIININNITYIIVILGIDSTYE